MRIYDSQYQAFGRLCQLRNHLLEQCTCIRLSISGQDYRIQKSSILLSYTAVWVFKTFSCFLSIHKENLKISGCSLIIMLHHSLYKDQYIIEGVSLILASFILGRYSLFIHVELHCSIIYAETTLKHWGVYFLANFHFDYVVCFILDLPLFKIPIGKW